MIKKLILFFACLFLYSGMAFAQMTVKGTVVSEEDGEPVVGATILVVGTQTGTVTDVDGKFSLTAARCVGACGLAPVMSVNDEVYGRITKNDVESILAKYA